LVSDAVAPTGSGGAYSRPENTMQRLSPIGVVAVESWTLGAEQDLLPEEARCVNTAAPQRRKEFAAGRRCARLALAQLGVGAVPILPGPERAPRWPAEIVGSITHSGNYCAAAVGRRTLFRGIGVDAERLGAVEASLWATICNAAEFAWLTAQSPLEQAALATKFFCAKEAFFKSQFPLTGRWLDFHAVSVTIADDGFEAKEAGGLAGRGRFAIVSEFVLAAMAIPNLTS
jgi:4'-phosphopantetheinyl transferase EntD